jgi:ubiquitin carboxyl-terminal hydrolase 14
VKWQSENYSDIELNTEEQPILFKAQLFALTGVQPERQKVMFKGKIVSDDSWNALPVKDGVQLLMMGTADPLPAAPVEQVKFMEDMDEDALASALQLPAGLTNLGNTCYLNATVQCLRTVPELKDALTKFAGRLNLGGASQPADNMTAALRDVYDSMEKQAVYTPLMLVQVLHMIFPRFAEKSDHGGFVQQDANECWTELMRMLQQKLKPLELEPANAGEQFVVAKASSFIDQYFGGTFSTTLKNTECADEAETCTTEDFLQLSCFISTDIKYMQSGLKLALTGKLTKYSSVLAKDCEYTKTSKISRLPAYLTVQFVRFFYKRGENRESVNAKILKDIKFTMTLDLNELCTDELQQKLVPMRNLNKQIEDRKAIEMAKPPGAKDNEVQTTKHPYSFSDDPGSSNSGLYELQAVLTHKGRSSSSGHYVAWVRRKANEWFMCDDDSVSLVQQDEILKLSGGGDWHTAYVLLYGPKVLETNDKPMDM